MALAASQRYLSDFAAQRPDRNTVLLYNTAIVALEATIGAIDRDDIEGRCRGVYAATEAVTSLFLNLDIRRSGEYADDLADVYGYILDCLVGINLYNDSKIAGDVIELLDSLKEHRSAVIGMVSACSSAMRSTPVTEGTKLEHNSLPSNST